MRVKRRRRKRKLELLILSMTFLLLLSGFAFWQEVQSKENNATLHVSDAQNFPLNPVEEKLPDRTKEDNKEKTTPVSNINEKDNSETVKEKPQKKQEVKKNNSTEKNIEQKNVDQKQSNENNATNPNKVPTKKESINKAPQTNISKEDKVVYLTFDDGPEYFTIDILNLLDKYNAKATFFMLEPKMRQYPNVVREIVKRGHQVGMHSVTHDKNKFYASKESVVAEMMKGQQTLQNITGKKSSLMRVPYGSVPHMKPDYIEAVNNAGLKMWDWNIDSMDWKHTDGSFVNNVIHQINNFKKNDKKVILLHDRKTTLNYLENLLIYLSANGYKMEKLEVTHIPVQFGK
ncbi:polysaccharide deacetylase family protein [Bacillus kwashiorkori]|uniref:polysaccharide deacetylase family protein n=1 Tax=Bacillus kwashiorkori TaxID=1522318 RepID=UPI0007848539|nr:polysaccharide deacetylase family protein [Bacillus kwashiorkori]